MVIRLVRSRIKRLDRLEECDRSVGHFARVAVPPLPILVSLLVLPLDGRFPDALPEDWERDASAFLGGDERAREMVQCRMDVVEEVPGDDGDVVCR